MIHLSKDDFTREILCFFDKDDKPLPKPSPRPRTHVVASPRHKVRKLIKFDSDGKVVDSPSNVLPKKFIEALQQNQQARLCCRHPENHDVIAFKSTPDEPSPDVYVLICPEDHLLGYTEDREEVHGEAHHTKFMVGSGERPSWDVR